MQRRLPRLTGISTPIGGLEWEYQEGDRAVAVRLISFLEDRRVLYVPTEAEIPDHCVQSVLEIRRFLTQELGSVAGRPHIADTIRALRAASRRFLDIAGKLAARDGLRPFESGTPSWVFNQALGELRGVFGVHVALLAERYNIDVEDDLAGIMPTSQDDDGSDWFFDRFPPDQRTGH